MPTQPESTDYVLERYRAYLDCLTCVQVDPRLWRRFGLVRRRQPHPAGSLPRPGGIAGPGRAGPSSPVAPDADGRGRLRVTRRQDFLNKQQPARRTGRRSRWDPEQRGAAAWIGIPFLTGTPGRSGIRPPRTETLSLGSWPVQAEGGMSE